MKRRRRKTLQPINAAGGIVIRGGREPLIAIVQVRKDDSWVLPKGKLNRNETAVAAARREVLEEVGHRVYIHEFLGTMAYEVNSGPNGDVMAHPVGPVHHDVRPVVELVDQALGHHPASDRPHGWRWS